MTLRRAARPALLLTTLLLLLPSGARAERVIREFLPTHRVADALQAQAEPVLAARGGSVVLDAARNALLLVGEEADVQAALEVLLALDQPLRTIVLRHEAVRTGELTRRGLEVRWSVSSGSVRAGNTTRLGTGSGVLLEPTRDTAGRSETTTSTVRVLEGSVARIGSGVTVPVRSRGPFVDTTYLVQVESGVAVRPIVFADGSLQLDITPFLGEVTRDGALVGAAAATTLRVLPGETVVIGGFDRDQNDNRRGTSGRASSETSDTLLLLVTAEVESDAGAGARPELAGARLAPKGN